MSKKKPIDGEAFRGRPGNALARAHRYMETGNLSDLGEGRAATNARMYVPSSMLPLDTSMQDEYDSPYYRKPKGFTPEQQAKRQQLIAEIRALTNDPNYDGVGKRVDTEMDSHRWHNARGGANPARMAHKIRAGHGHH